MTFDKFRAIIPVLFNFVVFFLLTMKINKLHVSVAFCIGVLATSAVQMTATELSKPRTGKWYFLYNTPASIMNKTDAGPYDSEESCEAAEEKAKKKGARVMGCRQY